MPQISKKCTIYTQTKNVAYICALKIIDKPLGVKWFQLPYFFLNYVFYIIKIYFNI